MNGRTFSEVASAKGGRSMGCKRCGAAQNHGLVAVSLRTLRENGGSPGARVNSRSLSFCESCAVEVYERVRDVLEGERP